MTIPLTAALAMAAQCAPSVAPETLLSVVQVESGFNPLAIGVNGAPRVAVRPTTKVEASARASALIAAGRSVDLGLAQINSKNLGWLGLSVEAAFDPCRNLAAAARVLEAGYNPGQAVTGGEQPALRRALSRYNTGDDRRGFANGYVQKVTRAAAQVVPALRDMTPAAGEDEALSATLAHNRVPSTPNWDVFGQVADGASFLIRPQTSAKSATGVAP